MIPAERRDLAEIPQVEWSEALETFINTLSSPRTAQAYRRAVIEAMDAIGAVYMTDVTAPDLARYRGDLVDPSATPALSDLVWPQGDTTCARCSHSIHCVQRCRNQYAWLWPESRLSPGVPGLLYTSPSLSQVFEERTGP